MSSSVQESLVAQKKVGPSAESSAQQIERSEQLEHPKQPKKTKRINLRTPELMKLVEAKLEEHYYSSLVEQMKQAGGVMTFGGKQSQGRTTLYLAKQFGFCYGVDRAIELAYAARKFFPERQLFLLGEIIHNPEVNGQMAAFGINNILNEKLQVRWEMLTPDDVVIVPAFGAEVKTVEAIKALGCQIVDTTCGDVMSVWKRVRQNAKEEVTSVIHGKAAHEETRATASHALGQEGKGHYLVVLNLEQTDYLCRYLVEGGDKEVFLRYFEGAFSDGFDPELHLQKIGVANQTTMLRSETEEVQRRLREALVARDGDTRHYRFFDTICGATQQRQDALVDLLEKPLDLLLVVGGYNSSNTMHLAEMGEKKLPTYFVLNATCLESPTRLRHFDLERHREVITETAWMQAYPDKEFHVGVTAGASCPNTLIEEVIARVLSLRGVEVAKEGETSW